jgi:hypothetical protein
VKHFFLKIIVLVALLFCAVLYGMDIAKQGMMKMEGVEKNDSNSSPLNFNIPSLGSKPAKADHNASTQTKTMSKPEAKGDDLESRIAKLNEIHGFNPFSSMGDKLSDGVSSVFEHGIEATASVISQLLK